MYEDCDPCPKHKGLYDGLAKALGKAYAVFDSAATTIELGAILGLIEEVADALRKDNPRFNEANFRKRLSEAKAKRSLNSGPIPPHTSSTTE